MEYHTKISDDPIRISLFLPFYTPKDQERAAELLDCLRRNLDCKEIDRVYLLQDDDTLPPFSDTHLKVLRLAQRPTYLDWVRFSKELCPNHLSVLANSDIYFDTNIAKLRTIFDTAPKTFVALSRYDQVKDTIIPHENPQWSQDTWAFLPSVEISSEMERQLDIPLGVPRCDNKVAYVFSVNGFTLVNPFDYVRSFHLHETSLRYYDKKGDTRIKGGMAMVHPSPALDSPSPVDIEIWTLNSTQYGTPKINKSMERWRNERMQERQAERRIFAYDAEWQYPAITEKHAYTRMSEELDAGQLLPDNTAYLAFPWATLIDLNTHAEHRRDKIVSLERALEGLTRDIAPYDRVITVCQHIRMRQFAELFARAGVTDIYWSHCELDQTHLPEQLNIALHPFPLYPVQQVPVSYDNIHAARPKLFSFVGAKSSAIYMTQARTMILETLKEDTRGIIIDRDSWHYNKIVYDKQILDRAISGPGSFEDGNAAKQFRQVMSDSLFTLCPSGTGPNSIRLWEAALNGSIPVVLSDRYQPPGAEDLWSMATVSCAETPPAIAALPNRLEAIRNDSALLRRKQLALYLLRQQYGPAGFINDILYTTP